MIYHSECNNTLLGFLPQYPGWVPTSATWNWAPVGQWRKQAWSHTHLLTPAPLLSSWGIWIEPWKHSRLWVSCLSKDKHNWLLWIGTRVLGNTLRTVLGIAQANSPRAVSTISFAKHPISPLAAPTDRFYLLFQIWHGIKSWSSFPCSLLPNQQHLRVLSQGYRVGVRVSSLKLLQVTELLLI